MINKVIDFDNKESREKSLADFKTLLDNPGWILVCSIVNANIEIIKNQIINGIGDEETIEEVSRLRDKLKAYQDVINTPNMMIERLKPIDNIIEESDDPYT